MFNDVLYILEIIGTIAFACSGAMVGLEKKMDIFGVCTLGIVNAVGGGVIRDVILGSTPPATFQHPVYAIIATVTSAILFIPAVRRFLFHKHQAYDTILLIMDSAGLGIFTVVGISAARAMGQGDNIFLMVFVGMVTGAGGGVLRDMLAGNTPYILVKHFYACASIIGALVSIFLWRHFGEFLSVCGGVAIIIILRLLAAKYHWNLPMAE